MSGASSAGQCEASEFPWRLCSAGEHFDELVVEIEAPVERLYRESLVFAVSTQMSISAWEELHLYRYEIDRNHSIRITSEESRQV
jgi:hypothetical protein